MMDPDMLNIEQKIAIAEELEVCPACEGECVIDHDPEEGPPITIECPYCNGAGEKRRYEL